MRERVICVICEINETGSPEIAECDDCLEEMNATNDEDQNGDFYEGP